jgi:hypothetical protein
MDNYDDKYTFFIEGKDKGGKFETQEESKSVGAYFDKLGVLHEDKVKAMFDTTLKNFLSKCN